MTGYERIVHDISIRRGDCAANQCVLKSLSDIACEVSESADTPDRRAAAAARGGQARDVRRPDPVHSNRRIAAGARRLTQDFCRSNVPHCIGIARRLIVRVIGGAAPRGGVTILPVVRGPWAPRILRAGAVRRRIGAAARKVPLIARKHASAHRTPGGRPAFNLSVASFFPFVPRPSGARRCHRTICLML